MDNEYAQGASAQMMDRSYGGSGAAGVRSGPAERTDLNSIRSRLEECIKRAADLGNGVHSLADSLVGSRPEVASNAKTPESLSPSLAQLVDALSSALNRIETGLSRI